MTERNLARHELIGLRVLVRRSPDPSLRGREGTVVDETRNTLVIEPLGGGRRLIVAKAGSAFLFTPPSAVGVELEGNRIRFRPEDRVKRCR